tara:strand:- start:8047 stop:8286 length:240 start_codon:yes stop_codon:yes gene_type:complete
MNFFDNLMAPLGKEHCMIYYVFGLFSLFLALIALVRGVLQVFNKKTSEMGIMLILHSVSMFLFYYLYRILYSICVKSLV